MRDDELVNRLLMELRTRRESVLTQLTALTHLQQVLSETISNENEREAQVLKAVIEACCGCIEDNEDD